MSVKNFSKRLSDGIKLGDFSVYISVEKEGRSSILKRTALWICVGTKTANVI
jgi:hypothetical protein